MNKEKLKRGFNIAFIIFVGLALAITYFFFIYSGNSIKETIAFIATILRPFLIGAVIAYIMKSTCNGYEKLILKGFDKSKRPVDAIRKKRANIFAVILSYITWTLIFALLMWIAIPQIIDSISTFINDLIENAPGYIETVTSWISNFKTQYPDLAPFLDQAWVALLTWAKTDLAPLIPEIGGTIISSVFDIVAIIKDVAIGLVISVFFLSGRKIFAAKSKLFVHCIFKEKHAKAIISEFRFADKMFGGFLEGKMIDSAIVGIIYYVAMVIMDIPYPALLAVICGVTNIVPFFGPFLGAIPSGLIILMSSDDPLKLLYFVIFVFIVQFLDGNILDPHIVGNNIRLSPFCVIFAVLLFGGLWGFGGLLVGVPLFAVIYDIVKKIVMSRFKKLGKLDLVEKQLGPFKNNSSKNKATVAVAAEPSCTSSQSTNENKVAQPDTSDAPDTPEVDDSVADSEESNSPIEK